MCLVTSVVSTLCDLMDHGLPGSSVHEVLQARILEWVAISFSIGRAQDWNKYGIWLMRMPQCLTHSSTQNFSPSFSISSLLLHSHEVLLWSPLFEKKKSVCIICMKLTSIFQIVSTLGGQDHSCSRCCRCLLRPGGMPCGWSCPSPSCWQHCGSTAIFSKGLPLSNFNCFGVRSSSQQPAANDFWCRSCKRQLH